MTRPEPRWLGRLAVDEAHYRQLREHGGAHGLRDENAFESALARSRHRWHYDVEARIPDLAAASAFGLIGDHPYVDGNKRLGLIVLVAFLHLNGYRLIASDSDAVTVILAVAQGRMTEDQLATWVDAYLRPAQSGPEP